MSYIKIDQKTKINIPMALLVTILMFFVSASFYIGGVITDFKAQDEMLEALIIDEAFRRETADIEIKSDLNEIKPAVIEIKTKLAGIETNLEWLVNERRNN